MCIHSIYTIKLQTKHVIEQTVFSCLIVNQRAKLKVSSKMQRDFYVHFEVQTFGQHIER
jgi:hypothetical protein